MIRTYSPGLIAVMLLAGCRTAPVTQTVPAATGIRLALGEAYLQAGRYDAARYHFDRVLKAQPQHTGALTGAALSAKCDQRPEIAEKYLNLAVNSPSGSDSVVQYILAYECPPDNSL
ncbi:tetratricopeptide repeat protein [Morganella morganii]|uniref:Tetratricopeptide repeat protein n=1 Tax=Morganella morganii TaxID=582 RepID=A0AAI9HNY4_MORMO|nr:tetratricopeptide repeat protein [Morganella morganii]EKW8759712.1 tetratricopeptide repeat protein [Morganella morganii]SHM53298.1 type IV pilus assembly protein PilF [Morganella morganii]HAS8350738.1 tetratricopeptide repeat protein [Vibrio vulnificus]HCE8950275.1 tetratricopeptide repeat protein [Morganella morganii]